MANSSYQFRFSHLFVAFVLTSFWLVSVRWGNPAVTALWMTFFLGLLCIGTARAVALTGSRRVFWSVLVLVTAGYSGAAIGLDAGGTSLPGEASLPTTNVLLWAKELTVQQDKQHKVKATHEHEDEHVHEPVWEEGEDPFGEFDEPIPATSDEEFSENFLADWPFKTVAVTYQNDARDWEREILMVNIGQTGIALLLGYLCSIYAVGLHNANAKKSVKPPLEN